MPPKTTQAPRSRAQPADLVAAQRVAGVDADADDVAGTHARGVEYLERFVADDRVAALRGRGGQHIQPARRDDGHAERDMAGIDKMYAHEDPSLSTSSIVLGRTVRNCERAPCSHA